MTSTTPAFPGAVTLLAGRFSDAVQKAFGAEHCLDFLTAEPARRHVWFACFDAETVATEKSVHLKSEDTESLKSGRSRDILRRYGLTAPGLITALGKLTQPQPLLPGGYKALDSLLRAKNSPPAKLLRHARSISQAMIVTLSVAPDWAVGAWVKDERYEAGLRLDIAQDLQTLDALAAVNGFGAGFRQAVSKSPSVDALIETIRNRRHDFMVVPPPPWIGTRNLVPLDTVEKINDAGRRFDNCLPLIIDKVISGEVYLYEFIDENEPAIVSLSPPMRGRWLWTLEQTAGLANADLSQGARDRIYAELIEGRAPIEPIASHILANIGHSRSKARALKGEMYTEHILANALESFIKKGRPDSPPL